MSETMKERIAGVLVRRRAEQFAFLKDLVGLNTETGSEQLPAKAEKVAKRLEVLGFEVERHALPDDRIDALGRAPLTHLVVRRRFGDGPVMAMVSHVDTLLPDDGWSIEPRAGMIRDGHMFGLGALTGKGHLAAQVFAILALADAGVPLNGSLELHISFDGEGSGQLGARWLLAEAMVKPDYAVAGGPAQAVALFSNGTMIIEAEVRGTSAPAFAPETGRDALEAACHAMTRLYQFRGGLAAQKSEIPGIGQASLVIEEISGGGPGGGVPGNVKFRLDRRLTPDEDPATVEKQLTNLIGTTIAKSPGVRCRIRRTRLVPPMTASDNIKPLRTAFNGPLGEKLGSQPRARGVAYDHEGRHYAAAGIPTVLYGAGPLDAAAAGMYGADECLALDDLRLATEVLALASINLLRAK